MWELLALVAILATITWSLIYDDGRFFSILLLALLIRLLVIPIFPYISGADVADYAPYFTQFATLAEAQGHFQAVIDFVAPHVPFYTILYPGYIFEVYGESGMTLIRVLNASLSLLVLPVGNVLSKTVFDRRFKRWQAALILFWPSYVFYSVEVGRTVPSVLLVCFTFLLFLRLIRSPTLSAVTFFLLAAIATIMMRRPYAVYIFGVVSIAYVYKVRQSDRVLVNIVFSLVVTAVFFVIGKSIFAYEFSLERINDLASGIAHGGSAYLVDIYPESVLDLLWYVPLQGVYYQFSPFIWDVFRISNPLTVVAFFQATLVLVMVFVIGFNIDSPLITWKAGLILLTVMAVPFILGIGVKNSGAAVRWRVPTDLLFLSLASTIFDGEYISDDTS